MMIVSNRGWDKERRAERQQATSQSYQSKPLRSFGGSCTSRARVVALIIFIVVSFCWGVLLVLIELTSRTKV